MYKQLYQRGAHKSLFSRVFFFLGACFPEILEILRLQNKFVSCWCLLKHYYTRTSIQGIACKQTYHLRDIIKSRSMRGMQEEMRKQGARSSLCSKRFQSRYSAKVGAGAKKWKGEGEGEGEGRIGNACPQTPRFWKTPLDISRLASFVS